VQVSADGFEQLQQSKTKSIDKDWTHRLCMELDLGLELSSCSRGDSGYGDGGSSGVIRDLCDGAADGGDRFSRLRAALSDEIECKVRSFHNKRVQDEELKEKEAKRAEELKQVAELIRLESARSHDVHILLYGVDGTPLSHDHLLSWNQGFSDITNDFNSFRSVRWRCNAVDDQTGEDCGFVCRCGANLEDIERSKLEYLSHIAHVHGCVISGTGSDQCHGLLRQQTQGQGWHTLPGVAGIIMNDALIGFDGITMESWYDGCTRCRGAKEVCKTCHGQASKDLSDYGGPRCYHT
jgi:hypothetical protein